MDQVMRQMQGARAEAGATLSRLDSIDQRNQDRKLLATTVQSDAEDLDMVQAISSFQSQQSGYSAALQTYATVQRMSLFDYIK
jgi:flagellar hook-associated protein 3 FlgL